MRSAQMGAAFALYSHYTVSDEPGIASMPTGSGKSGTMTLLSYLMGARRVLVVAPGRVVLDQLAAEFQSLATLRKAGIVPTEVSGPRTTVVRNRIRSIDSWEALAEFDVVLGTPSVLSPSIESVAPIPLGLFDLVIFDEAHHTPATTYNSILARMDDANLALFTATPFRRDRQPLPGKIVYAYSLRQALDEGILSPIRFVPIEAPIDAGREDIDRMLVAQAKGRLRSAEHVRVGSRIIARTDTVNHAKRLVEIYADAGLPMGLVVANTSRPDLQKTISAVTDGSMVGLVSVGAMGEGFDLPLLKIGVYHRPHSSLPATLQFLGRITRVLPEAPPAELLATRSDVSDETAELYASDGAWADLVPQLSDAAVADESARREYLRSFDPLPTRPLSLAAVRPRKYVQVYQIPPHLLDELDMHCAIRELSGGEVIYKGVDADSRVAVAITEHLDRPEWLDADTLDRHRYELHTLVIDRSQRFAFVQGTRDASIAEYLSCFGLEGARLVDPLWLDRLMASIAVDNYHSLGMRSARASGGRVAAYRQMAGSSVGGAVSAAETRSYGTGHAIARVKDPMRVSPDMVRTGDVPANTPTTSLGLSYARARVFAPDLAQLREFRNWCDRLVSLVDAQAESTPSGLPNLILRSPRRFEEFPQNAYACVMDPVLYGRGMVLWATHGRWPIESCELIIDAQRTAAIDVTLNSGDDLIWTGRFHVSGDISSLGPEASVLIPGSVEQATITDLLTEHAPQFFYGDGTSTLGSTLFQGQSDYPDLSSSALEAWGFEDADVRRESRPGRNGMLNIKQYATRSLTQNPACRFVIDDDRSGEAADLVVISEAGLLSASEGRWNLKLVHTKFSSEDDPGHRVEDLYELAAQAARSTRWCEPQRLAGRLLERIRNGSPVVHGDQGELLEILQRWVESPPYCEIEIMIVQPGLKIRGINDRPNLKILLTDVQDWIAQHDALFRVVGHSKH